MKIKVVWLFAATCIACGPGEATSDAGAVDSGKDGHVSATDAGTDATDAADAAADAAQSGDGGDGGANECQATFDAVINGGCVRCRPAERGMCTEGNAPATLGILQCLTTNACCGNVCWNEYDYNSAAPCMQGVIAQYGDTSTTAVHDKLTALGCAAVDSEMILGTTAIATELGNSDRVAFAACINGLTSCVLDSDAGPSVAACLAAATHWNPALCGN